MFSMCPFSRLLLACKRDILKTYELMLMPIGTSDTQGRGVKRSTLGSEGQRSRSRAAKDRFGGLAEASPLGRVGFLPGASFCDTSSVRRRHNWGVNSYSACTHLV